MVATHWHGSDSSGWPHIPARAGYPRVVDTAQEPNPYGYAGEGTVPDDDLEDTLESIAVPADDPTTTVAEAAGEAEDKR